MTLPAGTREFSLAGKRAVVFGAEHQVGRIAAVSLVEAGARILIASQASGTAAAMNETARAAEAAGQPDVPIQVQHAVVRADLSATVDLALKKLGGLEIAVIAFDEPFYAAADATDDSAFDRVIEDNFKCVWMACQEAGRAMLQRGGGAIVVMSNVMAERGMANAALYCAAKGAARNLVRALALEWARRGIRVNSIECGWLDEAGRAQTAADEFSRKLVSYLPYRRLLPPAEIAGALIYLVSPAAGFVTGESVAIDGGLLCRV